MTAHAQKPDFVFRRNGRVHLNRRGRQFTRLLAAEVCASAVVMLDTPCSEVVWRVLATHSIRQFPLHFPSCASPCAITFQLDSTDLSQRQMQCYIYSTSRNVNTSILHLSTPTNFKQCYRNGSTVRISAGRPATLTHVMPWLSSVPPCRCQNSTRPICPQTLLFTSFLLLHHSQTIIGCFKAYEIWQLCNTKLSH